jgi:hypothetical protein
MSGRRMRWEVVAVVLTLFVGEMSQGHVSSFSHYSRASPRSRSEGMMRVRRRAEKTVKFGVLAPKETSYQYSMQKILPAVMMAVKSTRIAELLPGWEFEINYRDTNCSSTTGPLVAFEFFVNKSAGLSGVNAIT